MSQENRSYRIRTQVGNHEPMIHVDMEQTIDTFEILSLKISQTSAYKLMNSDSGLIVGRVVANGGFGVPNAKVSVFVPYENTEDMKKRLMYYYTSPRDTNTQGIRYNLLPEQLDDVCHQSVGTFPDKRVLLDNDSWIEIFDKYYKYTTRTNNSGDYMIYGAPIGTQTIHVDVDLSDIGVLSQRPRDMVYKGANINQFESPNKFRVDTNLSSLAQIFTEDKTIYVYPFWGDTTDSDTGAAVTRCDINLSYKFEPTCIFMGSIITDTGENSLSKKCVAHKNQGKMSDMITGQGTIEMIRKTPDNKIEQYSVQGNQLIDSDGVWCYQIPMNLDYVTTDEFGNTVLTDDPNKGIATRARVRFRIGMTETGTEETARKRARFLVPNNPRLVEEDYPKFFETKEIDYEFGSKTKDENFRDLLWNKVYTVKSYIPRLQKSVQPQNKKYLGIKMVNHSGGNNPMPFNNLSIKFNFTYMFLCALLKVLVTVVRLTNKIICAIGMVAYQLFNVCRIDIHNFNETLQSAFYNLVGNGITWDDWKGSDFVRCVYLEWKSNSAPYTPQGLAKWFLRMAFDIGCGIILEGLCEDENGESKSYSPGSGKLTQSLNYALNELGAILEWSTNFSNVFSCSPNVAELYNCVENQLAQDNEVTSFNFMNDWVNGVLYMPLWFRKIKPKRRFLFFNLKAKDQWCSSDKRNGKGIFQRDLKLYRTCAQQINQKSVYELEPLADDYNTIDITNSKANEETGKEEISFKSINNDNCYGYQCHTQARTYLPIDYGLITEKETIYGEHVYYYRPIDYNKAYNNDVVTLYATDIVLLGSLSNCDIHGIPQFFKALSSTTYNMPPDLLVEDFVYDNNIDQNGDIDEEKDGVETISESDGYQSRMTEITGSDWGNLGVDQSGGTQEKSSNLYDNGGLFYGITCFDSYTKPKSCINLARICEFGVSLDESQDILEINEAKKVNTEDEIYDLYETLIPDGYVSYDEIYDMDYRSMFATLNSNWLKTKVNDNTGLTEYDFNRLYVENFDGLLSNIMKGQVTQKPTELTSNKANYSGNYNLEKNSEDYIKFRFGDYPKKDDNNINNDNNIMYFYDFNKNIGGLKNYRINTKRRFPRYENSFYFYFGLNEGKTAIDKFRTNYFAECTNDTKGELAYDITFVPNPWCGEETGYINFNTNLPTPISIELIDKDNPNNKYIASNINNEKFYVGYNHGTVIDGYKYIGLLVNGMEIGNLPTGEYKITLIDGEEEEYHDTISFNDEKIKYNCNTQAFIYNANELETQYTVVYDDGQINWKETFASIANQGVNVDNNCFNINTRTIGGTIVISNISSEIEYFTVSVKPVNTEFFGITEYAIYNSDENNSDEVVLTYKSDTQQYVTYQPSTDANNNVTYTEVIVANPTTTEEGDGIFKNKSNNFFQFTSAYVNYVYKYIDNYPGIVLKIQQNQNGSYQIIDNPQENIGYVFIDSLLKQIIIGVPYCDQKYKVQITEICGVEFDKDGKFVQYEKDSENSLINTVTVYSRVFTMYINGIDYDLIRNFKTGWVESTVQNMSKYKYNIDVDKFSSEDIYGWNDLDNIGKIVSREANVKSITEYFDGDSLKNYRNNNNPITNNELELIGDTLSVNFEGNGKPIYKRVSIYNPDNMLAPPVQKTVEYSTPYSWNNSYCYNADEWESDKLLLNEPATDSNTITNIIEKMDEIIKNRIEFTKQVKGAFCYEQDGKTLTVTYKSTATPIDYRCVGNQIGNNNEINEKNTRGTTDGSISVVKVDFTKMVGDFQIIGDKTTDEVVSNLPTLTYNTTIEDYKNYDECNNTYNLQYKLPYYFGIRDNNKNTLPSKGNEIGGINNEGHFQAVELDIIDAEEDTLNVSKMFGVHIYNKPMYLKVKRYWTGFKNYNYNGDYIDLPGFLRADVVNGIVNPQVNISDKTDVLYKIVDNDYTNIEVERYIYTDNSQSDKLYYGQYQISNGNNNDGTDIPDSEGGDEGVNGGITSIDNDSNSTNSNNLYQYIEINNTNNKTVIIRDGYCSDYETELNFDFSVNVDNSYFIYRNLPKNGQNLDYIKLNVNNAPSNNIKHYLFKYIENTNNVSNIAKYVYDELNEENTKWDIMPGFYNSINYLEYTNCINIYSSNRISIPVNYTIDENNRRIPIQPIKYTDKYFVLSVCDDKYYTLSPVIDYTPIRCFALWYNVEQNENEQWVKTSQNTDTIYLCCQIDFEGTDEQNNLITLSWSDYSNIQYLKEGNNISIKIPQYNDDLVNQIDFEYIDIYNQKIIIENKDIVTINILDKDTNDQIKPIRTSLQAIKIQLTEEIADWQQIDIIDCMGIRRHCTMDINSMITEGEIQQTSNE